MKKLLLLLIFSVGMIGLTTEAATPKITQSQCNIQITKQVKVWKDKYSLAVKTLVLFEQFSYNTADYISCLREAMQWTVEFTDCDWFYGGYRDDRNYIKDLWFLKNYWYITDYIPDYE